MRDFLHLNTSLIFSLTLKLTLLHLFVLAELDLSLNCISSTEEFYKQNLGVAMSLRMSSNYANLLIDYVLKPSYIVVLLITVLAQTYSPMNN